MNSILDAAFKEVAALEAAVKGIEFALANVRGARYRLSNADYASRSVRVLVQSGEPDPDVAAAAAKAARDVIVERATADMRRQLAEASRSIEASRDTLPGLAARAAIAAGIIARELKKESEDGT